MDLSAHFAAVTTRTHAGPTLKVGDRFTRTDSRPYRQDGERYTHDTTVLAEVTSTDSTGFKFTVVEMLAETNRPNFVGSPVGLGGGSFAWFGWDRAVAAGRAAVV